MTAKGLGSTTTKFFNQNSSILQNHSWFVFKVNGIGIKSSCIHLRKTYIHFSRHYPRATDKVFKKSIFERVQLINITQSYPIFIRVKTHVPIPCSTPPLKLNKRNNFENDLNLHNNPNGKKQISSEIIHELLPQYFGSIKSAVH